MARPKSTGEIKSHQQHLLMTPTEVQAIDDWRFANRIGSRGEAIRRLARNGLWIERDLGYLADRLEDFLSGLQELVDEEVTDLLDLAVDSDTGSEKAFTQLGRAVTRLGQAQVYLGAMSQAAKRLAGRTSAMIKAKSVEDGVSDFDETDALLFEEFNTYISGEFEARRLETALFALDTLTGDEWKEMAKLPPGSRRQWLEHTAARKGIKWTKEKPPE